MSIGANSYGSAAGVAALVPRYANGSGTFATTDRPTLAQVETFIDSVSGILNSILAEAGFQIPVTDDDVKDGLDFFVNEEVAAIAEGINGSGRLGPTSKAMGKAGHFSLILSDVQEFVSGNAAGFERLGATRAYAATAGLAYRDTDNSGAETAPIFQVQGFGNSFTDWDSD